MKTSNGRSRLSLLRRLAPAVLVLLTALFYLPASAAAQSVDIYVQAHQDDWQLFRGEQTYGDITYDTKVVFFYLTAGDAGQGSGYWSARKEAAKYSLVHIVGSGSFSCGTQYFSGHPIQRCTLGNTVSYFMRLPDGNNIDGNGYSTYGYTSLKNLRDSGTPSRQTTDLRPTALGAIYTSL